MPLINIKMNEIKRLQQLAGIITEIVVNNPTIKKLNATTIEDEEDDDYLYINYSDINVEGSIYNNEDVVVSVFDKDDEQNIENYNKLINLLKSSNIKDYKDEEDRYAKTIIIPLNNINL